MYTCMCRNTAMFLNPFFKSSPNPPQCNKESYQWVMLYQSECNSTISNKVNKTILLTKRNQDISSRFLPSTLVTLHCHQFDIEKFHMKVLDI